MQFCEFNNEDVDADYIGGTVHFECNHRNQIYGNTSNSDILLESKGI